MPTYDSVGAQNLPLTAIQRRLLLPVPGEVLVQEGDKVEASEIVARCQLPGKVWVADVSQALGLRREETLPYIRQEVGDFVQADDILAERKSRFSRRRWRCRAAVDGQVVSIGRGAILIEAEATPYDLGAPFTGSVTQLMPGQGVVISAVGALIQGVWGSGGEGTGTLQLMVDEPDEWLTDKSLETDDGLDDSAIDSDPKPQPILAVAGIIRDTATLEKAAEAQVAGLIIGSTDAALLPRLESLPFPVLVTEGFGALAIRAGAFALFQSHDGCKATITAHRPSRPQDGRPTVFIVLEPTKDQEPERLVPRPIQVGMRIRSLRAPYEGRTGAILELPTTPQTVRSGIRLPVAVVELDGGGRATIPLANLDFPG